VSCLDRAGFNAWCFAIASQANGADGTIDLAAFDRDVVRQDLQLCYFAFVVRATVTVDGSRLL